MYSRLVERTWRENILFSVLLELTYRCNLDCFFCYNDLAKQGRVLSTNRYLDLLEELAALQVLNLTLTGGEPLAHPGFWTIARKASELGFSVRIKSNGHAIGPEIAKRIQEEVRPFIVEVSLHGATEETHDKQTRVPGSFRRLMSNLQTMKNLGIRVRLNSTLTSWNEDELEAMYDLADGMNLPLYFDPAVTPRDDGNQDPLKIMASLDAVKRLTELMHRRGILTLPTDGSEKLNADPSGKNCGAGSVSLAIDPYGDVFPCVQWRRPIGNLHRQNIREIWYGNLQLEEIRDLTVQARKVVESKGKWGNFMAFCPGLAESLTGSPLEIYPMAESRRLAAEEVSAKVGGDGKEILRPEKIKWDHTAETQT